MARRRPPFWTPTLTGKTRAIGKRHMTGEELEGLFKAMEDERAAEWGGKDIMNPGKAFFKLVLAGSPWTEREMGGPL